MSYDLKKLKNEVKHWKTYPFLMFMMHYFVTIMPIILCLVLIARYPEYEVWTYSLTLFINGLIQNAFGLMMHEASHFFCHQNKKINDRLTNLLVCFPILNTVAGYRIQHFEHHKYVGTIQDPYYDLYTYRSKQQLLISFLSDLLLINAIIKFAKRYFPQKTLTRSNKVNQSSKPINYSVLLYYFWGIGLIQGGMFLIYYLCTSSWYTYVILWLLPLMTIPQLINRIRTIVEHLKLPGDDSKKVNRSIVPNWLEYFTIAPYGYSFHYIHHLIPNVPYYQLQLVHNNLVNQGTQFQSNQLSYGYIRSFLNLINSIPWIK